MELIICKDVGGEWRERSSMNGDCPLEYGMANKVYSTIRTVMPERQHPRSSTPLEFPEDLVEHLTENTFDSSFSEGSVSGHSTPSSSEDVWSMWNNMQQFETSVQEFCERYYGPGFYERNSIRPDSRRYAGEVSAEHQECSEIPTRLVREEPLLECAETVLQEFTAAPLHLHPVNNDPSPSTVLLTPLEHMEHIPAPSPPPPLYSPVFSDPELEALLDSDE